MEVRRASVVVLALASCLLLGDDCDVDRDALRESRAREQAAEEAGGVTLDPDSCLVLPSALPVGLSLVPGADDRLLVADPFPAVIPVDITTSPPSVASPPVTTITDPGVSLDGVVGISADLALATDPGNEQVLFVDAQDGSLREGEVGGVTQTGIPTAVTVTFPAGALDSEGNALPAPPLMTSFTSGAAAFAERLFVSTANGDWKAPAPVYLPGTVLVYDLDLSGSAPVQSGDPPQVIFTVGYNASHVTPYTSPGERRFVLVTTSGAVALVGGSRLDLAAGASDAARAGYVEAIEIFEDADPALVAVIPLGERAPAFGRIAIDPTGRVGALGSLVGVAGGVRGDKERRVLAVDLAVLDSLPAEAPATPVVLDGSDGNPDARIQDPSLEITPIAGGPTALSCSGTVVATAWTPDGRLLAVELCDGTLSSWGADVAAAPPDFTLREEVAVVAPFSPLSGELQAPVDLVVRDGGGGGPDVFLLLGLPGGALCGVASSGL